MELPVYGLDDFEAHRTTGADYFISDFPAHLRKHHFINRPHRHSFYLLMLFTAGSGRHIIDFKAYDVEPGTYFFMSPGQVHNWQLSENINGWVLGFSPEFYARQFNGRSPDDYPYLGSVLYDPRLMLADTQWLPRLELCFTEIFTEANSAEPDRHRLICDLLDMLLIRTGRALRAIQPQPAETASAGPLMQLRRMEKLVEAHCREHWPIQAYADAMNLSTRHLNDLCKTYLGKTTTELVQDRLVLEARRLMVHAELNISEIAYRLGFSEPAYFSRFFKKATGQSPEIWRKQREL